MSNIGLGPKRRTILLVDGDAHARAALRKVLEGAGFSVGEACSAQEGERTALRILPDAILTDLMVETIYAGHEIADRLRAAGHEIPLYVVSAAADALVGAVSFKELGISGVFLKPIDAAIVVQTLKTRLGAA